MLQTATFSKKYLQNKKEIAVRKGQKEVVKFLLTKACCPDFLDDLVLPKDLYSPHISKGSIFSLAYSNLVHLSRLSLCNYKFSTK